MDRMLHALMKLEMQLKEKRKTKSEGPILTPVQNVALIYQKENINIEKYWQYLRLHSRTKLGVPAKKKKRFSRLPPSVYKY